MLPDIAEVFLKPVNPFLAFEGLAVAGDDVDEINRLQLFERIGPLVDVAVNQIRDLVHEEIAGAQDTFLREVHDNVAAGVAAPQIEEPDLSIAAKQGDPVVEGHVGWRRLRLVDLLAERSLVT